MKVNQAMLADFFIHPACEDVSRVRLLVEFILCQWQRYKPQRWFSRLPAIPK